jgi:glycosyltransferase involved in cell wall biosynthesis
MLLALGAKSRQIKTLGPSALPAYFAERQPEFALSDLLASINPWYESLPVSNTERQTIRDMNAGPIGEGVLVIGAYGKVGYAKGSFALIEALDILAEKGRNFVFASVCGGTPRTLREYYRAILSRPKLARHTRLLPLLAPWRIPDFLRCCGVGCFLEHDFPISFHMPRVPREMLATGICLVCSKEVVLKQPFRENLVDGKNYILVDDPGKAGELASRLDALIQDPALTHSIGRHGYFLSRILERSVACVDATADAVEGYASRACTL